MLSENFQKLVVKEDLPELKGNIQYGDFVEIDRDTTPVADISEIWGVLEEQCEKSLKKIRELRNEIPVAINFYTMPHPKLQQYTMFGWKAWTLKQ